MQNNIPLGRIAETDDIVKVIIFLASKRISKITGQIIKVDGGRSLTSSGYVHYKGIQNMNAKFEPDSLNLENHFKNIFQKEEQKILEKPITDKDELKKFIEETITQSNFTTRDARGYFNIISNYCKVREIDSTLTNRYLKGSVPNMLLLEKKGETFGTMSYNPIQNPFNITNIFDKKLFYSQIGKGNYEEDNHNFEFKKYGNFNNYENYIINNKEKEEMIREINNSVNEDGNEENNKIVNKDENEEEKEDEKN